MKPSINIISRERMYSFWILTTRSYSSRVMVPES